METNTNQSLFKNRTYVLILLAGIFAVMGFSMFLTTTTWYVVTELNMPSMLGIVLIAATVPRLIMITYGGVLADQYKKTTIMFSTNLIQAILMFVIYLLIANDSMTLSLLLVLAALFGMLDAFFGPASSSMVPKIVPKSQLQQANAYFQGVDQVAFIIGPILAGVIMETRGVSDSYFVATVLILVSAIFVFPPLIKEKAVEWSQKQSPLKELKEGFHFVRSSGFLVTGILVLVVLNFFVFGSLHIAIPLLVDVHGGSPINLSYMEVSLGVGMVVGTLILSFIKLKRKGFASLIGLFSTLVFFLIFSMLPNLTLLTILLFVIGFSMAFVFIPVFTLAQENTQEHLMGRVMSLIFLAMNGFDPIAYGMVSGFVATGLNIQIVLLVSSIIGLAATAIIFWRGKEFKHIS